MLRPTFGRLTILVVAQLAALTVPAGSATDRTAESTAGLAPNVLIIVTDDQRLETLDVMPATRRLFGEQGTTFDDAFVTTPLCCPSRASIFTGRYAHNHGVENNVPGTSHDLAQHTTLAYHLRNAGYRTGIFGKYFNSWDLRDQPPYFMRWAIARNGYYDAKFNVQGRMRRIERYSTDYIADQAADFIRDNATADRPWFAYVAPNAPHTPFTPERDYARAAVPSWSASPATAETDRSDKPSFVRSSRWSQSEASEQRRLQLRTLMSVDDLVERLAATMRRTGVARDTLAIFVSDNGFFWGEHGLKDKRLPYTPAIRVPMLARWPGHFAAGAVDSRLVANVDIAATVLDATGVSPDHTLDGRSLLDATWTRDRILTEYRRDYQVTEIPSWASTVTDDYQYVEYYDDGGAVVFREYYDIAADPWQLDNLYGDDDAANNPPVAPLSQQLALDRACRGVTCP